MGATTLCHGTGTHRTLDITYEFATLAMPQNFRGSSQHQATPRADQIAVAAELWSTGQALCRDVQRGSGAPGMLPCAEGKDQSQMTRVFWHDENLYEFY